MNAVSSSIPKFNQSGRFSFRGIVKVASLAGGLTVAQPGWSGGGGGGGLKLVVGGADG